MQPEGVEVFLILHYNQNLEKMNFKKNTIKRIKAPFMSKSLAAGILAAGFLISCNDGKKNNEESEDLDLEQYDEQENTDNSYPDNAVADYLSYMDGEGDYEAGEPEPEEALEKLAAAVSERSTEYGLKVNEKLEEIEEDAASESEEMMTEVEAVVMAMKELQQKAYSDLSDEVQELEEEMNQIDASAENGKEQINAFFMRAASLIEEMDAPVDGTLEADGATIDPESDYSDEPDTINVEQ